MTNAIRTGSPIADQVAERVAANKRPPKCHMAYMPGSHRNCTNSFHEQSAQEVAEAIATNERIKLSSVIGHARFDLGHIPAPNGQDEAWQEEARKYQASVIDAEIADRQATADAMTAEANRPRSPAEQRIDEALAFWVTKGAIRATTEVQSLQGRWASLTSTGASPAATAPVEAELDSLGWAVPSWNPVRTAERAVEAARRQVELHIAAGEAPEIVAVVKQELAAAEAALDAALRDAGMEPAPTTRRRSGR